MREAGPGAADELDELPGAEDELAESAPDKMLTIPSAPKASKESSYSGTTYPGPMGGFSVRDTASFQVHVSISSDLFVPMANGFHISPEDLRQAVRVTTERGILRVRAFRKRQLPKLQVGPRSLMPKSNKIRDTLPIDF